MRQKNMVVNPTGLRPENDCAEEAQKQLLTTDTSSCLDMGPIWVPDTKPDWLTDRGLYHNFDFKARADCKQSSVSYESERIANSL